MSEVSDGQVARVAKIATVLRTSDSETSAKWVFSPGPRAALSSKLTGGADETEGSVGSTRGGTTVGAGGGAGGAGSSSGAPRPAQGVSRGGKSGTLTWKFFGDLLSGQSAKISWKLESTGASPDGILTFQSTQLYGMRIAFRFDFRVAACGQLLSESCWRRCFLGCLLLGFRASTVRRLFSHLRRLHTWPYLVLGLRLQGA